MEKMHRKRLYSTHLLMLFITLLGLVEGYNEDLVQTPATFFGYTPYRNIADISSVIVTGKDKNIVLVGAAERIYKIDLAHGTPIVDQYKLKPVGISKEAAADQCKLIYGENDPNCRNDIATMSLVKDNRRDDRIYACSTNHLKPVIKVFYVDKKRRLMGYDEGVQTPHVCGDSGVKSTVTVVSGSGKYFVANSYESGMYILQLLNTDLKLLVKDQSASQLNQGADLALEEPYFVGAYETCVTAGRYCTIKDERVWLFLTEYDKQSKQRVSRVAQFKLQQSSEIKDSWSNFLKTTIECEIMPGVILKEVTKIHKLPGERFLTVFSNGDGTMSALCEFSYEKIADMLNTNKHKVVEYGTDAHYFKSPSVVMKDLNEKRVKSRETERQTRCWTNIMGSGFPPEHTCFQPNVEQKRYLNEHRLLQGTYLVKATWWGMKSIKTMAVGPSYRGYILFGTSEGKILRFQGTRKPVEEIVLATDEDVQFLEVVDSPLTNDHISVIAASRNGFEILQIGGDRNCADRCCTETCCKVAEPFCMWNMDHSHGGNCRNGLDRRFYRSVSWQRDSPRRRYPYMRYRRTSHTMTALLQKSPSALSGDRIYQEGGTKDMRSSYSPVAYGPRPQSSMTAMFERRRVELAKMLKEQTPPLGQCKNWEFMTCLLEEQYESIWRRISKLTEFPEDADGRRKFLLKSNVITEFQEVMDYTSLWFLKIQDMMRDNAVHSRKQLTDTFPVSPHVWRVMSTYMSSIGLNCYDAYSRLLNDRSPYSMHGETGASQYSMMNTCGEDAKVTYPEIHNCMIETEPQLRAFLRADGGDDRVHYDTRKLSPNGRRLTIGRGTPIDFSFSQQSSYLNITFHYQQNPCDISPLEIDYLKPPRDKPLNFLADEIYKEIVHGIGSINSTFYNAQEAEWSRKNTNIWSRTNQWKTTIPSIDPSKRPTAQLMIRRKYLLFAQRFVLKDIAWPELIAVLTSRLHGFKCRSLTNSRSYIARLKTSERVQAKRFFQLRSQKRKYIWPMGNSTFYGKYGNLQSFRAMVTEGYDMNIEIQNSPNNHAETKIVFSVYLKTCRCKLKSRRPTAPNTKKMAKMAQVASKKRLSPQAYKRQREAAIRHFKMTQINRRRHTSKKEGSKDEDEARS